MKPKNLGALLLICGALFGAYYRGVTATSDYWIAKWSERDSRDRVAQSVNEAAERAKEQSHQRAILKAVKNGKVLLHKADTAAADAKRESDRLRITADSLANRISDSQASSNSGATSASQAATRAVVVLTDVFKRAENRAGQLAQEADKSRSRGVSCEQAFKGLQSPDIKSE